jgi:hypothetical protein
MAKGIDHLAPQGTPPPCFDLQVPLASLPRVMHTSLDTVPASVPYLHADEQLRRSVNRKVRGGTSRVRIGICWQGNPTFAADRQRSIPLKHFKALADIPGTQLYSLQKGVGTGQLKDWAAVIKSFDGLDESAGAFVATAAIMAGLDLVITSDTALAHLAGSLGVPAWVALPYVPDWRWLLEREDCPWYPSARLFRQTRNGQWHDVFERMARELRSLTC